jgi:hypothetical protein
MDAERLLDTGSFDSGWATRADTKVIGGGFGFPLVYFSKEDDILDDAIASNYLESGVEYKITTGPGGLDAYSLGAKAEAINRGLRLKSVCKNPPIVGLAISQDTVGQDGNAADYWTGHYDALGNFVPGGSNLHQFFFKDDGTIQYNNRVKQGNPDDNPKKAVDMFLQDWKPMCDQLSASSPLLDKVQYEVGEKMNFSRALLYAYSKPSLIWKFHFPDNSQCFQMVGGKRDYGLFLDYLFNVTGEMVDAGMLGIIYDSWSAEGSMSYSPDPLAVGSYGGLTDVVAEGALDNPVAGGSGGKEFTPFCELQKNSRKVLGITKNSYGQVLVAENSACTCAACTDTDYLTGACKLAPPGVTYTYPNNLPPQMFCNDGNPCVPSGVIEYDKFRCPRTCVDENKCVQCGDISTQTSFCKIDNSGEIFFANRTYGTLDDDYWEFLAGLPAQDKCCLERVTPGGETQEYTYDMRSGNKQRSEFLQYPTRGEAGIDCGRVPDTSFLKYCNIRIPISSREAVCWKVPSS